MGMIFVIRRLVGTETAQTGFTTLVTLVLFLGGIQLIAIGLLGEYLARIYDEVKQRPLFIIKKGYGLSIFSEKTDPFHYNDRNCSTGGHRLPNLRK